MANYRLEIGVVNRTKGRTVTGLASYICGRTLYDSYAHKPCYGRRNDVRYYDIFLPVNAPPEFGDLQRLCDKIEEAETRYDARTARQFIASLPNELSYQDDIQIVQEYITENFLQHGLCAIAAIHTGIHETDSSRDNPHAHIIVPTRTLDDCGFSRKKFREFDRKENMSRWRQTWADVQNSAYERNALPIRVSHESLEVQGVRDRKPRIHLTHARYQLEQRREPTLSEDRLLVPPPRLERQPERTLPERERERKREIEMIR